VVAVQEENGDTVIRANRNRLIFEIVCRSPVASSTRIQQEQEVENRWVFRFRRGGTATAFFVGRRSDQSDRIDRNSATGTQFPAGAVPSRAQQTATRCQELRRGPRLSSSDAQLGDLFGLEAQLNLPYWASTPSFNLDLSASTRRTSPTGTRSWEK